MTSIQRHPALTPTLHTLSPFLSFFLSFFLSLSLPLSPGYSSLSTALPLVPYSGSTVYAVLYS